MSTKIETGEASRFRAHVRDVVTKRFKRKFALFVACDLVLVALSVLISTKTLAIGVAIALTLSVRVLFALPVLWNVDDAFSFYTNIAYHRTSLLRRYSNATHNAYFSTWIAISYVLAIALLLVAVVVGSAAVLVSFGSSTLLQAFAVLSSELTAIAVTVYLVLSEQLAYKVCVTDTVDGALSSPETRKAFAFAASLVHNQRTDVLFDKKTTAIVERRSNARNLDATSGGGAPDAKHDRQHHQ